MTNSAFPSVLAEAFGDPLPDPEARAWAALSPAQKLRAIQRLSALRRWHGERDGWTVEDAAEAALMGKNHFYALSAKWEDEEARSLAILGVQARAPRRRKSRYDDGLMREIRERAEELVSREPDDPTDWPAVTVVIAAIEARFADDDRDLPGTPTLRSVVTEARRRRMMKGALGGDIAFDICACEIPDAAGQPHVAFVCIDRGTGYIHAFRFDDPADSVAAHKRLADDVMMRGSGTPDAKFPWVERTRMVELVIGGDLEAFRRWEAKLRLRIGQAGSSGPAGVNLQGSNKPRRFGRYLRGALGTKIGRVKLLPARTVGKPGADPAAPLGGKGYSRSEATLRLNLEVADHNASVLALLGDGGKTAMPKPIAAVFKLIAGDAED